MLEYIKAVATKAAGTASVTFLAGFASEGVFHDGTWAQSAVTGASTAAVGALVSVVIPALQRMAAKAAATEVPKY